MKHDGMGVLSSFTKCYVKFVLSPIEYFVLIQLQSQFKRRFEVVGFVMKYRQDRQYMQLELFSNGFMLIFIEGFGRDGKGSK